MAYDMAGTWFKGNTHIHSTRSDGGKTHRQLAAMYARKGYDFLFRTDHRLPSDVRAETCRYPLAWFDGVELDGKDETGSYFHVVCLGTFTGITPDLGFPAAMQQAREQGGLRILAHPFWTGNTAADVDRWEFDGVEVYNHVCRWLNGKGDGLVHWHQALGRRPRTLGLAVDDAHITADHPGWNGAWVMVKAPVCTQEVILASLRAGNFYASCGPRFDSIECTAGRVTVKTSPVRFVRLVGPGWLGCRLGTFRGPLLTEASFDLPAWPYAYLEVEDARGRRAWTQTLVP